MTLSMPTGTAETVTIMLSFIETMDKELAEDMGDRLRRVQEKEGAHNVVMSHRTLE